MTYAERLELVQRAEAAQDAARIAHEATCAATAQTERLAAAGLHELAAIAHEGRGITGVADARSHRAIAVVLRGAP